MGAVECEFSHRWNLAVRRCIAGWGTVLFALETPLLAPECPALFPQSFRTSCPSPEPGSRRSS